MAIVQEETQKMLLIRRLITLSHNIMIIYVDYYAFNYMSSQSLVFHSITLVFRDNNDIPYAILYLVDNQKVGFGYKPERVQLEATTFDDVKGTDGAEEY